MPRTARRWCPTAAARLYEACLRDGQTVAAMVYNVSPSRIREVLRLYSYPPLKRGRKKRKA